MKINIEKLIQVIKKQHGLYDTTARDYYDRSIKRKLWEDVCTILHSNWDKADNNEKILYGKEVQKKWQSLRDCFRRELAAQKAPPNSNVKKKVKYKFFDALQFLTPFTQIMVNEISDQEGGTLSTFDPEPSSYKQLMVDGSEQSRKRKHSSTDEENTVVKEVPRTADNNRYFADDEAFLQSLLPVFKEFTLEQKLLLRIELMKTILQFKQAQNEGKMVLSMKYEADSDDDHLTMDV